MRTERARRAFMTGITGQDGSYLAELLLNKGYEVTDWFDGPRLLPQDASNTCTSMRTSPTRDCSSITAICQTVTG
jgi:GDP-mannose 4,6 dehydratase